MTKKGLKGISKGKKWKKGHSCVSNPSITKFRDQAKQQLLAAIKENSQLTIGTFNIYDDLENTTDSLANLQTEDIDPEDYKSITSFKTFATNFTSHTIPAFESFFKNFDIQSNKHCQMLALHNNAQNFIREKGLTENSTSYFCSLIDQLMSVMNEEEFVNAGIMLMKKVIRKVERDVLRIKYGECEKIFYEIFKLHPEAENLFPNLFGCLSTLLRAQPYSQWENSSTHNLFKKMLHFVISENHKIRHAAQSNVGLVINRSCFMPDCRRSEGEEIEGKFNVIHPAAQTVGDFIKTCLQEAHNVKRSHKMTLHLLVQLRIVIAHLPKDTLSDLCGILLFHIHELKMIKSMNSLSCLKTLFEATDSAANEDLTRELVWALRKWEGNNSPKGLVLVPSINNRDMCISWMQTVNCGVIKLNRMNNVEGFKVLTDWINHLANCWESEHSEVQKEASQAMADLFEECITPLGKDVSNKKRELELIVKSVEKGLRLSCKIAWPYVLGTLSMLFKVLGPHQPLLLDGPLKTLISYYEQLEPDDRGIVESAIGHGIKEVGFLSVIRHIPIDISGNARKDEKSFWILPLLNKYMQSSPCSQFIECLYPITLKCQIIIKSTNKDQTTKSIIGIIYSTVESQIWSLLPKFTKDSNDIDSALQMQVPNSANTKVPFAKFLCDSIANRADIRLHLLKALRGICENTNSRLISNFSHNYVYALLNLIFMKVLGKDDDHVNSIEKGQRDAAIQTFRSLLKIMTKEKLMECFKKVEARLKNQTEEYEVKCCIDILKEFLPYLPASNINDICTIAVEALSQEKSNKHKGAFGMIDSLCKCESDDCVAFVKSNFWHLYEKIAKTVPALNARCVRLGALRSLLKNLPSGLDESFADEKLKEILDLAVYHFERKNSRIIKKAAYGLLLDTAKHFQNVYDAPSPNEIVSKYIDLLLPTFSSLKENKIANTTDAITAIVIKFKDMISVGTLGKVMRENIQNLAVPSRIITKSCLLCLRASFAIFPSDVMEEHAADVVIALANMPEDCKRKFRVKIRDILCSLCRKYDHNFIKASIPMKDVVMHKRLKNIVKSELKKKKSERMKDDHTEKKDLLKSTASMKDILDELDMEDEDDFDDEEKKEEEKLPKKILKKHKVQIKEGNEDEIVDLLSMPAISTKPKKIKFDLPSSKKSDPKIDVVTGKLIFPGWEKKSHQEKDDLQEMMNMVKEDDDDECFNSMQQSKKEERLTDLKCLEEDSSDTDDDEKVAKAPRRKKKRGRIGAEFKAKKAGGDVKKGGVDPYAYVQLNRNMLNKRMKAQYEAEFKGIVKVKNRSVKRLKKNK